MWYVYGMARELEREKRITITIFFLNPILASVCLWKSTIAHKADERTCVRAKKKKKKWPEMTISTKNCSFSKCSFWFVRFFCRCLLCSHSSPKKKPTRKKVFSLTKQSYVFFLLLVQGMISVFISTFCCFKCHFRSKRHSTDEMKIAGKSSSVFFFCSPFRLLLFIWYSLSFSISFEKYAVFPK